MQRKGSAHRTGFSSPGIARQIIKRTSRKVVCWYVGLWDGWYKRKTGFNDLPPSYLRFRVHGQPHVDGFLKVGKQCMEDIETALRKIGKDLGSFQDVLDFGCGCGRTLIWSANRSQGTRFYGTDIDAEAIAWCRTNLKLASFEVNDPQPPLPYPAGMFDLICAISVFTHLDEAHQWCWLDELKRVAKPGAILLLTFQGFNCWKHIPEEQIAIIQANGFLFAQLSPRWKGVFPEWYQSAFHTRDYILQHYSNYFEVLEYLPAGLCNHLDMVILRAP